MYVKKLKVMPIFGTRPEAIKMAPLILELKKRAAEFETVVTVTAQHREMLDQVLEIFEITPDYDLDVMQPNQTITTITTNVMNRLEEVIQAEKPDIILVHGDTTTTFAASLAAFYNKTAIGHVEAGLRTWNKYSPYPEEMNRQLTDVLSDLYFAPTLQSKENLLQENHSVNQVYVTGNTAIDALKQTVAQDYQHDILEKVDFSKKVILVTMHRRENQGKPMEQVFKAMKDVVNKHPDTEIIYPVHLSPTVQKLAHAAFDDVERVHLIAPLDVVDFHNLAARCHFIMSDSGGVQEEAPSLGKPVLVLRDTTERPEGIAAGTLKLVGTEYENVKQEMTVLLEDETQYQQMAQAKNPYGDGQASRRILDAIAYHFGQLTDRPQDFS